MDPEDTDSGGGSEPPTCRICLEATGDGNETLIRPCRCTGTTAFVHNSCLTKWLRFSGHDHCEVCCAPLAVTRRPGTLRDRFVTSFRLATGLARHEALATVIALVCLVIAIWLIYKFRWPGDWSAHMGLLLGVLVICVSVLIVTVTWCMFFINRWHIVLAAWRARRTEGVNVGIEMVELGGR